MARRALERLPTVGWVTLSIGLVCSCEGDDAPTLVPSAGSSTAGSSPAETSSAGTSESSVVRSEAPSRDETASAPTTSAETSAHTTHTDSSSSDPASSVATADGASGETTSTGASNSDSDGAPGRLEPDAGSSSDVPTSAPPDWLAATPELCTFEISGAPSPQISMVGVVDWSTDMADVSSARIEFYLDDPEPGELNVGSGGEVPTTGPAFMLGLKSNRSYTYHLIAESGATTCVSSDRHLVTPVDPEMPIVTTNLASEQRTNGFIVAAAYGGSKHAIIDADDDVVWWFTPPYGGPRIHMDWDGQYMWMLKGNELTRGIPTNGRVFRVRMDGSELEEIMGVETTHHDFAVLPGGVTAFLMGDDSDGVTDDGNFLVERAADGTLTSLTRMDESALFFGAEDYYHYNALRYVAQDDAYTVSDLRWAGIAKFNRQGECLWQMSRQCATAPSEYCAATSPSGSHGHQLLPNGNLLYFGTLPSVPTPVVELSMSVVDGVLTTEEVWSYTSEYSTLTFGDVQRLPNRNTVITYSNSGVIQEVSPNKEVVRELDADFSVGYTTFRETLYGPPQ